MQHVQGKRTIIGGSAWLSCSSQSSSHKVGKPMFDSLKLATSALTFRAGQRSSGLSMNTSMKDSRSITSKVDERLKELNGKRDKLHLMSQVHSKADYS